MVKRAVLGASTKRQIETLFGDLKKTATQGDTVAPGVKDLGENGDVIWTRPDAPEFSVSIREVDADLADAQGRIDAAESELFDSGIRLGLAEQAVADAVATIDGKVDDVDLDDPDTAERVATAMSLATKKLIVTEEAILNHATLIGQTVVDDINVNGTLIGQDGVFTGTVDFANVNVTGEAIVDKLAATGISASLIEGGSFVGESFEGGVFTGGLFKTSDALPGQVELADNGYITHLDGGGAFPGLRITPINTSNMKHPAGIGPSTNGLTIYGGQSTSGGSSVVQASPDGSFLRTFRPGAGTGGEIQTTPTYSHMRTLRADGGDGGEVKTTGTQSFLRTVAPDGSRGVALAEPDSVGLTTYGPDGNVQSSIGVGSTSALIRSRSGIGGESGWMQANTGNVEMAYVNSSNQYVSRIRATPEEALLHTVAGGVDRYLSVDANGVWVKTNKSGSWKHYNLEETAQDSGWINQSYPSGMSRPHGAPFARRDMGKRTWWRGRFQKSSGKFEAGVATVLFTLEASDRPEHTTGLITPSQGTSITRIEVSAGTGNVTARPGADTAWVSIDGLFVDQ